MRKKFFLPLLILMLFMVLIGCADNENRPQTQTGGQDTEPDITDSITESESQPETTESDIQSQAESDEFGYVTEGTETYRNFVIDNVLFCYGTGDPFVRQFEACIEALQEAGVSVESNVLEGMGHGYGFIGDWIPAYDVWLTNIFENN